MRVRKLHLKNIGPFEDAEIEFKPTGSTQEIHIFTGPNGSGKTTLLQAIAIFFGSPSQNIVALLKRMHSYDTSEIRVEVEAEFDGKNEVHTVNRSKISQSGPYGGDFTYSLNLLDLPHIASRNKKENWRAFAYSGYRAINAVQVNAIQEPPPGFAALAFSEALIFDKQLIENKPPFTLNQWIANSISKRALAKEKNRKSEASQYASAMTALELTVSKIIGYEIQFDLQTSPLALVVRANGAELSFDVLPDGLRSAISWIGDLLMRLDPMSLGITEPINQQRIFLFLDEIEVHLHPAWQRNILPVVKDFFPNATIFLSTHSPFVVNSIDGAWVYELKVKDGKAELAEVTKSVSGRSYQNVLREVFDIDEDFGGQAQTDLDKFYQLRDAVLQDDEVNEAAFLKLAKKIALQGVELQNIIIFELRQLSRVKNKTYEI